MMFVVLQALAINFYARHSTSYNNAQLLSASNVFTGALYEGLADAHAYFSLRGDNRVMMEELAALHTRLAMMDTAANLAPLPALSPYTYTTARVVNNSTSRQENFFTINRGAKDGITLKSAILSPANEALGYVVASSDHYSVCISMLNTKMHTSGKLKGTAYFGSLFWDGKSTRFMTMSEVSRYAAVQKGDTVLTTDYSSIFPPDALVGMVEDWKMSKNASYYEVRVRLAADFSALRDVFVVKYRDAAERTQLEKQSQTQLQTKY